MISKIIRLSLTALIFIWSVYQFATGHIGNGIFFLLLSGIPLLTYFRNERVLIALWYLRKNQMDKAEKSLLKIKDPDHSLIKGQQAYYYLLMGMIESQRGVGKAESMLRKSLSIGLRQKTDQALAKLNLAGIALAKGRKREATTLLTEVKKLDEKGLLNEQVRFMKEQMKKIGGPQMMGRRF
jgi:tetratricopeptide (TPR) repeat protein